MKAIRSITPREAKAVWDSLRSPSTRGVARAMTQAGRRIHHSTIARWWARDWRPVASGEHPIEAAREALDIAARLLTGDPGGGVELLERYANGSGRFEGLTEQELVRRATRELLIALIVVAEVFRLHAHMLVPKKTGETATLLKALGKAMSAATNSFGRIDSHPGPTRLRRVHPSESRCSPATV
jgi:hypothetical protein